MMQRISLVLASVTIGLLVVGCGGPDLPDTLPVTGTVTYQGKPVSHVSVIFSHSAGGRQASGDTDEQGKFDLSTFDPGDGAKIGEHMVTVFALTEELEDDESTEPPRPLASIPAKYANSRTSGLKLTVKSGEPNKFLIELQD